MYHITLTVPSREPLLGALVVSDDDPSKAHIERTALGNAVVDELYVMCRHYPAIRILQFCLMPDHLHAIIHVRQVMDTSIRAVIRGYWQGVKKHGRAYTLSVASELNSEPTNEGAYPFPVFTERPFIRPLSRRGQLHTMIRYVQMNPQRLATKRLKPGFFRVQKEISVGNRSYDGVGNVGLLMQELTQPNRPFARFFAQGLDPVRRYRFYNLARRVDIRCFGSLVNAVFPIHIRQGSLLHRAVAKAVSMPGELEALEAPGAVLMRAGVKLKPAFAASGYNGNVRYFPDFAARLYFMEAADAPATESGEAAEAIPEETIPEEKPAEITEEIPGEMAEAARGEAGAKAAGKDTSANAAMKESPAEPLANSGTPAAAPEGCRETAGAANSNE